MQQVPELADQTACGRFGIIRPKECRQTGVLLESFNHLGEGIRMNHHIPIDEEDEVGEGGFSPIISRGGGAEGFLVTDHACAVLPRSVGGVIGRSVIDDNQFVVCPMRGPKTPKAALEVEPAIANRDHDRERGRPVFRRRRTGGEIVHDIPSPVIMPRVVCNSVRGVARNRAWTVAYGSDRDLWAATHRRRTWIGDCWRQSRRGGKVT